MSLYRATWRIMTVYNSPNLLIVFLVGVKLKLKTITKTECYIGETPHKNHKAISLVHIQHLDFLPNEHGMLAEYSGGMSLAFHAYGRGSICSPVHHRAPI